MFHVIMTPPKVAAQRRHIQRLEAREYEALQRRQPDYSPAFVWIDETTPSGPRRRRWVLCYCGNPNCPGSHWE